MTSREEWSGQEVLYCVCGGEGRRLNTPQWDWAWSDWLRSYGSCWLEVGAEGEFKLDLRQDHDPGKQKLKGTVRTETYRRHYCQQSFPSSCNLWACRIHPMCLLPKFTACTSQSSGLSCGPRPQGLNSGHCRTRPWNAGSRVTERPWAGSQQILLPSRG
jgi:hypothetical protein